MARRKQDENWHKNGLGDKRAKIKIRPRQFPISAARSPLDNSIQPSQSTRKNTEINPAAYSPKFPVTFSIMLGIHGMQRAIPAAAEKI
jgi:hypothetical protein